MKKETPVPFWGCYVFRVFLSLNYLEAVLVGKLGSSNVISEFLNGVVIFNRLWLTFLKQPGKSHLTLQIHLKE